MKNVEFNQVPKELEGVLMDAAFEVARSYESFQRATPETKAEAQQVFYAAAHLVEKIVKGAVPSVEGILTETTIQAIVHGQLKTTILAHGPITSMFIGSATRRIANDVLGHLQQASLRDLSNTAAALEVARLRKEVKDIKLQVDKKQANVDNLLKKLRDAGLLEGDKHAETR